MNHGAIASKLNGYKSAIQYLQQNHPSIPLIFSEVGNSIDTTHNYAFQAVLGSALWLVDWQLYAMSIVSQNLSKSIRRTLLLYNKHRVP